MAFPRKRRPASPQSTPGSDRETGDTPSGERLQKVLAAAGIGSRRECETLILEGRVEVDKTVVTELGRRVDPAEHEIRVDGVALTNPRRLYIALNKPVGVVCTNYDPDGRTRVIDLIKTDQRLFPVGRLDRTSEGLILVTNDGELANRLTHPRYGVAKKYLVRVAGQPTQEQLESLLHGVHLAEGFAKASAIHVKKRQKQCTDMEITLDEGKNREIRRLLARVGHKVVRLKRIAMGSLKLGELRSGEYRKLTDDELRELKECIARAKAAAKSPPRVTGKIRPSRPPKTGGRTGPKGRPTKAGGVARTGGAGRAGNASGRSATRPARPDQAARPGTRPPRPVRPVTSVPPAGAQGSILGYDDSEGSPPPSRDKEKGKGKPRPPFAFQPKPQGKSTGKGKGRFPRRKPRS